MELETVLFEETHFDANGRRTTLLKYDQSVLVGFLRACVVPLQRRCGFLDVGWLSSVSIGDRRNIMRVGTSASVLC
eukprot:2620687-Amphidinium_carterae.1